MKQILRRSLFLAGVLAGLALPGAASAQQSLATTPAPAAEVPSTSADVVVGPRITQVGVSRAPDFTTATVGTAQGTASRRDVAWMLIGGAGLVVGSVVGGDAGTIIMVSGAVIGLLGLWHYLQ